MALEINNHYKEILDNLKDAVLFVDRDKIIRYWNRSAEYISGCSSKEIIGKSCHDMFLCKDDLLWNPCCDKCLIEMALNEESPDNAEIYIYHKDGSKILIDSRMSVVKNHQGEILGVVRSFNENKDKQKIMEKLVNLEKIAYSDPLTDLASRRYAESFLNMKLSDVRRYGYNFGVVLFDIDHFKEINDRYGHEAGDEVLKEVSKALSSQIRASDIISRWGGDEFLIMLSSVDQQILTGIAKKFQMTVANICVKYEEVELKTTISLGVTIVKNEDNIHTILKRADELLYLSKKNGRNQFSFG